MGQIIRARFTSQPLGRMPPREGPPIRKSPSHHHLATSDDVLLLPSLPSYTSSQLLPSDIDISMIYNESNSYEAFSENNNYNISQELGVKDVVTAKHGSEVNDYNRLNEAGNNFIDSNEIENISNNINGL